MSRSISTAYLHLSRGDVTSIARKKVIFWGISTVVFQVIFSGGVLSLNVSGKAGFFPAVRNICSFGNIIRMS